MKINVTPKNDYSYLFTSMNQANRTGGGMSDLTSLLGDYSSIKSGSYGKLMKAYYGRNASDEVGEMVDKNKTTDAEKTISKVGTAADSLKKSAEAVTEKFKNAESDQDALFDAASSFVNSYNSLVNATKNVKDTTIANRAESMVNATTVAGKQLAKVGITINSDNTLSIDKDAFNKADASAKNTLFAGNSSYAYRVSAAASLIDFAATQASSKAGYTATGNYNTNNTGALFNSFF